MLDLNRGLVDDLDLRGLRDASTLWADRFPPEARLLLRALCLLVGLKPSEDPDTGEVLWNKTARVLMGAPSLPAMREFQETTLQELDILEGVPQAAVEQVGKIVISTPTLTAEHAAGWCAAAGKLIEWVKAVADYRGAQDRARRRAEEEAAAAAEAAARKALEEQHEAGDGEERLEVRWMGGLLLGSLLGSLLG